MAFGSVELEVVNEVIPEPTEWTIDGDRDVLVVHLDGVMHGLRTELQGHGSSRGNPAGGEVWSIPAGRRYRSSATGGRIRYAVLQLDRTSGDGDVALGPGFDLAPLAGVFDEFLFAATRRIAALANEASDVARMCVAGIGGSLRRHVAERYGDGLTRGRFRRPTSRINGADVGRIERYVGDRLAESLDTASMASVVGMSEAAFVRAFRETFGTTPWQYVIRRRVDRARELLENTRLDLTAIALRCGFTHHSHMARTFRKRFDRPPSRFR